MNRKNYLDNLKVFLTLLVIFHHAGLAYGNGGGWAYTPSNPLDCFSPRFSAFLFGYCMSGAVFQVARMCFLYFRKGGWDGLHDKANKIVGLILYLVPFAVYTPSPPVSIYF